MLRPSHGAAILFGILLLAGCSQTKTYRVTADPKAPAELAAALKDKTFHEGRNLFADFDNTHKLYGVITNGELESLTLEIKDYEPETIVFVMPDPKPGNPDELPQDCDKLFDNCMAPCGDRCCQLECFFQWRKCLLEPGHPPGPGFVIM